jgi:hypothetical protein
VFSNSVNFFLCFAAVASPSAIPVAVEDSDESRRL